MTDLATHQRGLLALVTGAPDQPPPDDPYLAEVATSGALPIARGIAARWRAYTLRRLCPLTWDALDQRGRLGAVLDALGHRSLSPFLRLLADAFVAEAVGDADARGDDVVAAVARFERSMLLPPSPGHEHDPVVIDWPCDPDALLLALVEGRPALDLPRARHRTTATAGDPTAVAIQPL